MLKKNGKYDIDEKGIIKRNNKELKFQLNSKGYYVFNKCENGISKKTLVHRIVAETFIPNPNNLPQVNHKNGIKTDNRVKNLEWCDNSYNQKHARKNGLIKENKKGDEAPKSKKVMMYNENISIVFGSLRSALEYLNKPYSCYSSIAHCCSGRNKTAYGYYWKYI